MTEPHTAPTAGPPPRSLRFKINRLFILFGLVLAASLTIQGILSQRLIVHPVWRELLASRTAEYLAGGAPLPVDGRIRGWRLDGSSPLPAAVPRYFASLAPGFYDESQLDPFDADHSYAVLVTPAGAGRVIMVVDISDLEDLQNLSSMVSVLIAVLSGVMIVGALSWLYRSMRRPMQSLSQRLEALDPEQPEQRLQTDFALRELHDIAVLVNGHLDRVERFIERERSLLDQASHEFRTPIAVIAGAVDVLRLHDLPPAAHAPLDRIGATTRDLAETMSALLLLAREPDGKAPAELTRLDLLVAALVEDHSHLLASGNAAFVVAAMQPQVVDGPDAIVRIVVGNLLRNAAEHAFNEPVTVSLAAGRLQVRNSGAHFDTAAAARNYTAALRDSSRQKGGQGLGLFLIRRVCERYGWDMTLTSDPINGTLAEIDFRIAKARSSPAD